jgi:hypothetical protein
LAALKAENEMLKRHVDAVLRKSQQFYSKRKEAEEKMVIHGVLMELQTVES